MGKDDKIILQVQIASLGQEGINRVAAHSHPHIPGVRWLVSLQDPDKNVIIPQSLLDRDDFEITVRHERGVSKNRNNALDYGLVSEFTLLSDDDVDYNEQSLIDLINAFRNHPEADIICCRYTVNGQYKKPYCNGIFNLDKPPFGWYPSLIEMAFRTSSGHNVRFNEKIGPGSDHIIAGEDSIWFVDMMRQGAKGICVPIDLCSHDGESTGSRMSSDPGFLKAHGACMTHAKPYSWLPRLVVQSLRSGISPIRYLRYTCSGAIYALCHRLFRTTNS
ncbi:MAG: glycosyltransferase family 2 protein [Muribaculaceae bacterium]|nr:glycosyltransferase family 2 protein [Muribaculaceae bacterium]